MTGSLGLAEMLVYLGRLPHLGDSPGSISPAQWAALRFLARANRFSRTVSGVAAFQSTTRGTASQLVKSLEAKGLIARRTDERDRRSAQLNLTDAGRAALSNDPFDVLVAATDNLDDDERDAVGAALKRLIRIMADRSGLSEFGNCDDCIHLEGPVPPCAPDIAMRCGLTGQGLDADETSQLCINFRSTGERPTFAQTDAIKVAPTGHT